MADINFNCSHCGQNLDAPEDMAGWDIECPACSKPIQVPDRPRKVETGIIETDASSKHQPEEEKESTVRIDIPPESTQPPPSRRIVKIKRKR